MVKVKAVFTTLVVIVALALGFSAFGPGSATDRDDNQVLVSVSLSFDNSPRNLGIRVSAFAEGARQIRDEVHTSPWSDTFWASRGQLSRLESQQRDSGTLTCTISTPGRRPVTLTVSGERAVCRVSLVA